jgi:hypothetical protein
MVAHFCDGGSSLKFMSQRYPFRHSLVYTFQNFGKLQINVEECERFESLSLAKNRLVTEWVFL